MLQEIAEGKWVASFRRALELNGIGHGSQIAVIAETQSRPVLTQLCGLALFDIGAHYSTIVLPTPPQTCLLYTSPSPRDKRQSRMPSSA